MEFAATAPSLDEYWVKVIKKVATTDMPQPTHFVFNSGFSILLHRKINDLISFVIAKWEHSLHLSFADKSLAQSPRYLMNMRHRGQRVYL
jgi:hypothetical protein